MRLPFFQVDAFTDKLFHGNPAGIVLLREPLDDAACQAVAAENNLSETAFVLPQNGLFGLRWFTPTVEVDLCGHATLASAYVLFEERLAQGGLVRFETVSGPLEVRQADGMLLMDFPSRPPKPISRPDELTEALGARPQEVQQARDLMAVFSTADDVARLTPDFRRLERLEAFAVCVTAPGDDCDFVSRFFAPRGGIDEDPVTGSAHCTLIPYWAARLGKKRLHARQISERGGELWCADLGERVLIAGKAVVYLRGEIMV